MMQISFSKLRDGARFQALSEALLEAIVSKKLGTFDGDGAGGGVYDVFFEGSDERKMFRAIRPLLEKGPWDWAKVEVGVGWETKARRWSARYRLDRPVERGGAWAIEKRPIAKEDD